MRARRQIFSVKKVLIFIGILAVVFGLQYFITKKSIKGNIIVTSLTYYNVSKLYPPNTAVLLFRGNHDLSLKPFLKCISKNTFGDTVETITTPKSAYDSVWPCKMHTFIAACKTAPNPTEFYLSTIDSSEEIAAKIPIRNAIQEKLGIVSCLNPMFFAEKWQIIALSIEWYSHFGVDRQIYYFISALKGIYDMLKVYEKEKLISIEYFTVPDIKEADSKLQLDYHDQAGAFNDCYLNYREAADFIIVHDSDDLIYLNGNKFYQFFAQTWISNPQTAFIHFISTFAEVYSNKTLQNFDINFTMKSLNILPVTDRGKSVYNTSLIETVWSHHSTVYDPKLKPKIIQDSEGMQIHARYFYDVNESFVDEVSLISRPLTTDIQIINEKFLQRKQILSRHQSIATMESSNRYYTVIDKCVQSIGGDNAKIIGCRTHYACKIPRFYNVQCIEARQSYQKYQISEQFNIFVAKTPSKPILNLNGCSL